MELGQGRRNRGCQGCYSTPCLLENQTICNKIYHFHREIYPCLFKSTPCLKFVPAPLNSVQPTSRYNRHVFFGSKKCFSFISTSSQPTSRYNRHLQPTCISRYLRCRLNRVPLQLTVIIKRSAKFWKSLLQFYNISSFFVSFTGPCMYLKCFFVRCFFFKQF